MSRAQRQLFMALNTEFPGITWRGAPLGVNQF